MRNCRRRRASATERSAHSSYDAFLSPVWCCLPLVVIAVPLTGPRPVHAKPQQTKIEEPGEVDHLPVEATTIMPDGEAVDETIEDWRKSYNQVRSDSSLNNLTPAQYARTISTTNSEPAIF